MFDENEYMMMKMNTGWWKWVMGIKDEWSGLGDGWYEQEKWLMLDKMDDLNKKLCIQDFEDGGCLLGGCLLDQE